MEKRFRGDHAASSRPRELLHLEEAHLVEGAAEEVDGVAVADGLFGELAVKFCRFVNVGGGFLEKG
jgi:hypothetical protein